MNQAFQDWIDEARAVSVMDAAIAAGVKFKRGQKAGPCPSCGGDDRFSVSPGKNAWICRGAKGGYDGIGLVMHVNECDFIAACELLTGRSAPNGREGKADPQAIREAQERRERNEREVENRHKDEERKASEKRSRARRTWAGRVDVADTPAESYFQKRKLEAWRGIPTIGFHPKVWHDFDRREYPALLGCAVGPDMKFKSLWRIFIDEHGHKANASQVKMGLGLLEGGAVWLATREQMQDRTWGACEGIETGLAIRELFKGENDRPLPVFATLSRAGLQSFILPPFVEHLSIYPDGDLIKRDNKGQWQADGDGQISAAKLALRLKEENFSHQIVDPSMDSDWNDVLIAEKERSSV